MTGTYGWLAAALILISGMFFLLERVTQTGFFLNLATLPVEVLIGGILVDRYLAHKERERRARQLMYLKSCIFRSTMRNLFLANFAALAEPPITMAMIHKASLTELKAMRVGAKQVRYRSLEAMEPVIMEYVESYSVFYSFMEWAIAHDSERIFEDMIRVMHFIQDVRSFKQHFPDELFIHHAQQRPELMEKVSQVLSDGIVKFLEYAIELKEKQPVVFEDLMDDYETASLVQAGKGSDKRSR